MKPKTIHLVLTNSIALLTGVRSIEVGQYRLTIFGTGWGVSFPLDQVDSVRVFTEGA